MAVLRQRIIQGRAWVDPRMDALVDRVEAVMGPYTKVDPDRLDAAAAAVAPGTDEIVQAMAWLRDDPQRQLQMVIAVGEYLAPAAVDLARRAEQAAARGARDDEADLRALSAQGFLMIAWQIRGSGWASSVREDRWGPFREMVDRAEVQCEAACAAVPDHPAASALRMWTAIGGGLRNTAEWHARFAGATRRVPTLYPAHFWMMTALTPKWYGSLGAMFGFARAVAARAPEGDPVVAMLPLAHAFLLEAHLTDKGDHCDPPREAAAGLAEMRAAREKWLVGRTPVEAVAAHPFGLEANQLFGWALRHSDGRLSKEHLAVHSAREAYMPWGAYGNANAYSAHLTRNRIRVTD